MAQIDLTGQRFGRLIVLDRYTTGVGRKTRLFWNCLCDCGNKTSVRSDALKAGTMSCGCLGAERRKKACTKHGNSLSPEYNTWRNIKQRCSNPKRKCAEHYVGKGIRVCDRWLHSFENFISDMGNRPSDIHTIERRQNNLGYSPENCYWGTRKMQSRNYANRNVWIEYGGRRMILQDWATELRVRPPAITYYLKKGESFDWVYNYMQKK